MKNLVLFWGWTRNEHTYQRLIGSAPADWRIYRVSYEQLIPHGDMQLFKQNFLKFLEENKLSKFYLAGHSLRGALSLDFTYHFPNKVQELFLIDSAGVYDFQAIHHEVKAMLNRHPKYKSFSDPRWASLKRILRHPILHARLGLHAHFVDLQKEASEIKTPTTIMWGADDKLTPVRQGERLHELIKGSKFIVLQGEGHDWILFYPELFWENII